MSNSGITVVTWLYQGNRDYKPEHVERFYRQFDKHYEGQYRALCITDQKVSVESLPIPEATKGFPHPNFAKLWIWSREAQEAIGGRVFVSDIDVDVVGPVNRLLDRSEDVVLWHDPLYPMRYSGGNTLLTLGSRPEIWESFSVEKIPAMRKWHEQKYGRCTGADQAWLCYAAGDEATFGPGIYRARTLKRLPKDASIVHYPGDLKPWHLKAKVKYRWIR